MISDTKDFRISVMALLVYSDWLIRYGTIMLPEYFPSKDERAFVRWVNDYYVEYGEVPTETNIRHGMYYNAVLDDVIGCPVDGLEYAATTALEYAQMQEMKLAIMQSVDDIKDGKLHLPLERVKDALKVGLDVSNLGMDLLGDMDTWVHTELHGKRFPTGWKTIDRILGGGIVVGEYGLIMAPPGRGKTTALINIGYALAGLFCAANVTHVTLEMPEAKVLKRYGARISGMRLMRGGSYDAEQFSRHVEKHARAKLKGKLRVVSAFRDLEGIRWAVDNLVSEGHETEALIVDYPDLMTTRRKYGEKRFELAAITRDLRHYGNDAGFPVWAATQTGRHTFYKEVITEGDVAEAIEKISIADVAISICQTRDEEKQSLGRLYMAKIRDGARGYSVPVKIDFENQAIIQRGKTGARR